MSEHSTELIQTTENKQKTPQRRRGCSNHLNQHMTLSLDVWPPKH